ncbi:MAG: cobyrinate a,c-diamide synthase [Candidatus Rokubacteria bacterium]|nr:cobyrinate a,c-diamide synthase [Candidatus Rokubacteria bacterium]
MSRVPALVVAGIASGVGKTTLTLGLAAALRRRGLRVRAAKVGPDFIDPGFHEAVTGAPSRTLDGWMLSPDALRRSFARTGAGADLVLVEGMMGLFDGLDGRSEVGSTAQVAKLLGAPVVLVLDASALVRSAGAIVLGAERYDPDLEIAGVIWNGAGGERHVRWLAESLEGRCRAASLGWLPRQGDLHLPERHLGLVTARERRFDPGLLARLGELVEAHVDLERLLALARSGVEGEVEPAAPPETRARIGVALDEAFQFYYPENLELLREAGAELLFWSPLKDPDLPDVDGLYLGGGYPEVHAKELAANDSMRAAIRAFTLGGGPLYAECGGLMYLAERLEDLEGTLHPMVGLLPLTVRMLPRRLTLGYREVILEAPSLLGGPGTLLRGHEFHHSHADSDLAGIERVYRVSDPGEGRVWPEGYRLASVLASYVHLHFGSNPAAARAFVAACEARRR